MQKYWYLIWRRNAGYAKRTDDATGVTWMTLIFIGLLLI